MTTPFGAVRTLESIEGFQFTSEQLALVKEHCERENAKERDAIARWWNGSLNTGVCTVGTKNAGPSKRQAENAQAMQTGKMLARSEMLEHLKRAGIPEHLWETIVK